MFSTLRTRFGIPGVISVIALVFAMFGGAYAASNSSGGGKATASAKAKKGPRGPKGATGPAGAQGPAGPKGDAGANGSNGAAGKDGAGVTSKTLSTSSTTCNHQGGSEFTSASGTTTACNGAKGEPGEPGEPWTVGGTLPEGATLTGTYGPPHSFETVIATTHIWMQEGTSYQQPISFNIPLSVAPAFIVVPAEPNPQGGPPVFGTANGCPGVINGIPSADSGKFCVYEDPSNFPLELVSLTVSDPTQEDKPGVGPAGTLLEASCAAGVTLGLCKGAAGIWAVTG